MKTYEKIDDDSWKIIETQQVVTRINIKHLLEERSYFQARLDEIDALIAQIDAEKAKEK